MTLGKILTQFGIEPRLLPRKLAAAYCGVSEATFTTYIVPYVPPVTIGAKLLWDRKSIDQWLDRAADSISVSPKQWLERVE
jgi:predicted DNA-binding transcriptional regulator AlpA